MDKHLLRMYDANLNRLREALRVCEDITRFTLEDRRGTSRLKRIRHDVHSAVSGSRGITYRSLVSQRDPYGDIGKESIVSELKRGDLPAVMCANFQRAKESARVLEELSKITDRKTAQRFKDIRFRIYGAEKTLAIRL